MGQSAACVVCIGRQQRLKMLRPAARLLCGHFMRVSLACLLLLLTLLARAAASSNSVFAVGSLGAEDPHACGAGEVGLVDGATAKWIAGSCIAALDWAGDAETATAIEAGVVVVYVNPGLGADTHLYTVDFSARNVSKVLVGGDQGELRCASVAGRPSCFGVSPGDDDDVTQLIEVDAVTGDSSPVLNLTSYEGFSVGGSVVDPINMRYHFIAVGEPHLRAIPTAPVSVPPRPRPTAMRRRCRRAALCSPPPSDRSAAAAEPSDQWLVTIDLKRMTIIAEAPLSRNFMGPLSVSEAHGLATFNAEGYNGLVAVNYSTGKLQPLLLRDFDSVTQFCGAFSRDSVFVASAYPSPTRFYALRLPSRGAAELVANATFESNGIVFAAAW